MTEKANGPKKEKPASSGSPTPEQWDEFLDSPEVADLIKEEAKTVGKGKTWTPKI